MDKLCPIFPLVFFAGFLLGGFVAIFVLTNKPRL